MLSFKDGVRWKKAGFMKEGDLVASPAEIGFESEKEYSEDDAYFLGLFVAEGGSNPFGITTGSNVLKDWILRYVKERFGYEASVRKDNRRENEVYTVILRDKTRKMMQGLDRCKAGDKFVPEAVFLSDVGVINSFLGGYFDGDAEVSETNISVTTKS